MGAAQRRKGANYELEVAAGYRKAGYPKARRKLSQYQETDGQDLENVGPFSVQCKCGKSISWVKAYREAEASAKENDYVIAHIKVDHQGRFVLMSEDDWFELLKMLMVYGVI